MTDSRPVDGWPTWRRRRRACPSPECYARWWTVELPEETLLAVRTTPAETMRIIDTAIKDLLEVRAKLTNIER